MCIGKADVSPSAATVEPLPDEALPVCQKVPYARAVPPAPSPTARALQTLEMLRVRPGTTAEQIAARLGVSSRAVRRYVEILREAGVPVESSRGRYGGYRLGRGTRLPPAFFTGDEALGLVMAVLEGHSEATDESGLVDSGIDKLIGAFPENIGRQAAALRDYAVTAPDHRGAHPDPAITSALIVAAASHCRVRLRYRSEAGNEWNEEADPWAVVVRYGRWYLLCHSHRAGAVRSYRLDRVGAVEQTCQPFTPPEVVDPFAALEECLGDGRAFPTRVVFKGSLSEVSPWIRPPMGRLQPHPSGCVLVGSTDNPTMYAEEWLARIPFAFRIEDCDELRAAVAALASRCAAAVWGDVRGELHEVRRRDTDMSPRQQGDKVGRTDV
jgi:predicted DNA-binding transcriptional regulator YafY